MTEPVEILINCCHDTTTFVEYVKSAVAIPLNPLGEEIESLSLERFTLFSQNVFKLLSEACVDVNADSKKVFAAVSCMRTVVTRSVSHNLLVESVKFIHDHILSFTAENMYVQNVCCLLLEEWWSNDLPGKCSVALNIPFYLLSRFSSAVGKAEDMMRLNAIKETLKLVSSDCPSRNTLSSLVGFAATNPQSLKSVDGVEFLAHVLVATPELMKSTHTALKSVIPGSRYLSKIGEIYYKAVGLAGNLSTEYTSTVLQDLAKCALYCHRTGPNKAAGDVLKVLSVLHKHKKDHQIENTLYDMYNPILWRALDLPNGHVRASAASLLLDVFPLIRPQCPVVQFDETLNVQCGKIQNLLNDDDEVVRVCAVRGTAKVLDKFWEFIPAHHLMSIFTTLTTEMPLDRTSNEVVVTALQGVQLLLNNPLCHAALKKVMPVLQNHIYHPSPSVRHAMVSLLETLHQTRIMKFWDLVPAEELLSLVEGSSSQNRSRLVSLLVPLYLPSDADLSTLIPITMDLLEKHPTLHRVLYTAMYTQVGMGPSLRLSVGLLALVRKCAEQGEVTLSEDSSPLLSSDSERIAQVLEVVAILLNCSARDTAKNGKAAGWVTSKVVPVVPELLERYGGDGRCCEALSIIIGSLPEQGLPPLEELCYTHYRTSSKIPVKSSLAKAILRADAGDNLLSDWTKEISTRLEGILKKGVVRPGQEDGLIQVSSQSTIQVLTTLLSSNELSLILESPEASSLYCTLLSSCDVIVSSSQLRTDVEEFLAGALGVAARLTPHMGGVSEMNEVAECLQRVLETSKSGNNLRGLLIQDVLPACVEGFLILPYSGNLLETIHLILEQLGESEMISQRLTIAKYLYKAGGYLGVKPNFGVNLGELFGKFLKVILSSQAINRKSLEDVVGCLLLEMGVTAQRQSVTSAKQQPWSGIPEMLVDHITEKGDPFWVLLEQCCAGSSSFKEWMLPTLQRGSTTREDVREFLSTI